MPKHEPQSSLSLPKVQSSSLDRSVASFIVNFLRLPPTGAYRSLLLATVSAVAFVSIVNSLGSFAFAQDGAGAAEEAVVEQNVLVSFYTALGPIYFFVFLIMSFMLVALLVMGILAVRKSSFVPTDLIAGVDESLQAGDPQTAVDLVRADESFLGQIVSAGLSKLSLGKPQALEAMQIVGEDETMKLEHKLGYLALIGNIAPMVGLLGTVNGMITSFGVIARSQQTPKPSVLAGGIQTALYTTMVGLILAIPAIVAYNLLKTRMQRMVASAGNEGEVMIDRFAEVVR